MQKTGLEYRVVSGAHITKVEGEALFTVIRNKFKGKRPLAAQLLAEARRKSSPIHGLFEWDDRRAARAQRLARAGYLLRSINVVRVAVKDRCCGQRARALCHPGRDQPSSGHSL